jgi:hypothetical protein
MPRLILLSMDPLAHHMSCIILWHFSILYWLGTFNSCICVFSSCICVFFFPMDAGFEKSEPEYDHLPFEGLSQHVSKAEWGSLKPLLWTSTLAVQTGKRASSSLLPLPKDGYVLTFSFLIHNMQLSCMILEDKKQQKKQGTFACSSRTPRQTHKG